MEKETFVIGCLTFFIFHLGRTIGVLYERF